MSGVMPLALKKKMAAQIQRIEFQDTMPVFMTIVFNMKLVDY